MSIKENIINDIKIAMKNKDDFTRDALRTLSAALKQVEVDSRQVLSNEQILSILQKEIKKRNDAKDIYLKGGREDLAKKEQDEANLISKYMPKQLSDIELIEKLKNIKSKINATSIKDLGNIVKTAKQELGATADAKRISEIAKSILQ